VDVPREVEEEEEEGGGLRDTDVPNEDRWGDRGFERLESDGEGWEGWGTGEDALEDERDEWKSECLDEDDEESLLSCADEGRSGDGPRTCGGVDFSDVLEVDTDGATDEEVDTTELLEVVVLKLGDLPADEPDPVLPSVDDNGGVELCSVVTCCSFDFNNDDTEDKGDLDSTSSLASLLRSSCSSAATASSERPWDDEVWESNGLVAEDQADSCKDGELEAEAVLMSSRW
jgi:hypothetical protein